MEESKILAVIDKGLTNIGSKFEAQMAELNETAKKRLVPDEVKSSAEVAKEEAEKAELKQLGGIMEFEVWDIPIGQAAVGGFISVFASELIDGFLVNRSDWIKGLVKLAGAGVAIKWGSRILGKTGAAAVGILLAYDGVRSLIPIDTWAERGSTALSGVAAGGGLGGFKSNVGAETRAAGVEEDYYAGLYGGGR